MSRIKDAITKTCIAHEPAISYAYKECTKNRNVCFEIFGFDVLLDDKLRPHLMEVNCGPDKSASSNLDKMVKTGVYCDAYNLLGMVPYDRK